MQPSSPTKSSGRPSILKYALPASFVVPTVIGDTSTAVTAPVIAYSLGRGGPKTWAASLVWNGLGLVDLFYAQTLAYVTGATTYLFASDPLILLGAYLAAIFHIVTFIFLLQERSVNHLLWQ